MLGLAWKSLGWFLAGVAVALGFLLVPLQVAAERKKLDRTASDIVRAHRDIRALETEFDTRANLAQLDKWNAENLKLVAPSADQFVGDEAALAALEPTQAQAGPQLASFVPSASANVLTGQQPVVAPAAAIVPVPRAAASAAAPAAPAPREAMAAIAKPRPRAAVALLDRALLDDSVIGDLRSGARAEIGSAR